MKGLIKFTLLFLSLIAIRDNLQAQKDFSEEQIGKMLKSFYTAYIMTFEDYLKSNPGHPEQLTAKIDSIEKTYLTSKLYNYLKTINKDGLVLDSDPFIGGQMIDKSMLYEMTFDEIENDLYQVRYKYGDYYHTVKLRIGTENGLYKIRDAFIDTTIGESELTKDEWRKN